ARELFAERGYANATTRDIASWAGASEVLLFRYFRSKAQLFEEAISEPFDEFMHEMSLQRSQAFSEGADVATAGRMFAEALYRRLLNERQLILSLITTRAYEGGAGGGERPHGLQHYFAAAQNNLKGMYEREGASPEVDPALSARVAFAAVVACALLEDWLFADLAGPDEVAEALGRFVARGLFGHS
ncbi:MAG: helix-turn-helix transcriptional regulator, partial [Caulobacteraceae bacterium]|nr:helix-turn-helix transcriptional regulator [Caulobacteraceae bacterium]